MVAGCRDGTQVAERQGSTWASVEQVPGEVANAQRYTEDRDSQQQTSKGIDQEGGCEGAGNECASVTKHPPGGQVIRSGPFGRAGALR